MKRLALTTAALLALSAAPAVAAAQSTQSHGQFTMAQARTVDLRHEQSAWGNKATVGACRFTSDRRVTCAVTTSPLVATDGGSATRYAWSDTVTRSGSCSLPVTSRTSATSGLASGSDVGWRNCFTGPLVVLGSGLRIAA